MWYNRPATGRVKIWMQDIICQNPNGTLRLMFSQGILHFLKARMQRSFGLSFHEEAATKICSPKKVFCTCYQSPWKTPVKEFSCSKGASKRLATLLKNEKPLHIFIQVFDHKCRERILLSTVIFNTENIKRDRDERKFSVVVTVNLTKQVLNQTLKINCKVLLVPTKFSKMLL